MAGHIRQATRNVCIERVKMNKGLIWNGVNLIEKTYDDSYAFLSDAVGGFIEHVPINALEEKHISMYCNEEGKLIDGLKPTLMLTYEGKPWDIVKGSVAFLRYNDDGESLPLTDDDINTISNLFNSAEYYIVSSVSPEGECLAIPAISY